MSEIDLMTDFEREQEKHALITAENERRTRLRLAAANRKRGLPEPKGGDVLHVRLVGGMKRRTRGGLKFAAGASVEVRVVDGPDAEVAERQRKGDSVVSVNGAEEILGDDGAFAVRAAPHGDDAELLAAERQRADSAEAKLKLLQAEIASMKAARSAPESTDGRPTRLPAARAARGAAEAAVDPDGKLFPEKQ